MANLRLAHAVFGLIAVVIGCTLQTEAMEKIPTVVDVGNCRSSSDCGLGGCCVIGMMRYSVPYCQRLKQLGDSCRPASDTPSNLTLSYPNGLEVSVTDVYNIMCPCDATKGLICNKMADAICTPREELIGNGIS